MQAWPNELDSLNRIYYFAHSRTLFAIKKIVNRKIGRLIFIIMFRNNYSGLLKRIVTSAYSRSNVDRSIDKWNVVTGKITKAILICLLRFHSDCVIRNGFSLETSNNINIIEKFCRNSRQCILICYFVQSFTDTFQVRQYNIFTKY